MSVNTAQRHNINYTHSNGQNQSSHNNAVTEHIIRNIILRLDNLQSNQLQSIRTSYGQSSNPIDNINPELLRIHSNIKAISDTNIENLKRLESTMGDNLNELVQHISNIESRIVRLLKQKQESLQFIQYRVVSVENSQKNVTEFMRRVAEQQTQKYSGVNLLEQRIKQIERIGQLRSQKQSDNLKIMYEQIQKLIAEKIKNISKFTQSQSQSQTKQKQKQKQKQKKRVDSSSMAQLDEIKDQIKVMEIEIKEQKRKSMKIEQSIIQNETQISDLGKNMEKISKQIKNIQSQHINQTQPQTQIQTRTQNLEHHRTQQSNNNKLRKNSVQDQHYSISRPSSKSSLNKQIEPHYLKPSVEDHSHTYHRGSSPRQGNFQSVKYNRQEIGGHGVKVTSSPQEDDPFISNVDSMATGIRGLLRKSKEKDQRISKPQPKSLPRQSKLQPAPARSLAALTRNLPPVQPDPRKAQLASLYSNQYEQHNEQEQQQQQQVYQVDEQGYLIDEDGNYMVDQEGNRVQISEDELMNLTSD